MYMAMAAMALKSAMDGYGRYNNLDLLPFFWYGSEARNGGSTAWSILFWALSQSWYTHSMHIGFKHSFRLIDPQPSKTSWSNSKSIDNHIFPQKDPSEWYPRQKTLQIKQSPGWDCVFFKYFEISLQKGLLWAADFASFGEELFHQNNFLLLALARVVSDTCHGTT